MHRAEGESLKDGRIWNFNSHNDCNRYDDNDDDDDDNNNNTYIQFWNF
jgi:hypothetical protein